MNARSNDGLSTLARRARIPVASAKYCMKNIAFAVVGLLRLGLSLVIKNKHPFSHLVHSLWLRWLQFARIVVRVVFREVFSS